MGFVLIDHMNVCTKFEVALPTPEIIGVTGSQKILAVPGYAHSPYSPKNPIGKSTICIDYYYMCTHFPAIFDYSFLDGSCEPPIYGKGAYGVANLKLVPSLFWMVPSKRALASSYRPSIQIIPLSALVCQKF